MCEILQNKQTNNITVDAKEIVTLNIYVNIAIGRRVTRPINENIIIFCEKHKMTCFCLKIAIINASGLFKTINDRK